MVWISPPKRNLAIVLAVLASLGLAGCDNDDVIFIDDGPPAVPTGVYTITGNGQVRIVWNPVREDDVEGYGVYRSRELDGAYERIATVYGVESTTHTDFDVVNGSTYFYAVDAFDFEGHESELSYEDAFDTPRPAGANLIVFAKEHDPTRSGVDLSDYDTPGFVAPFNAADTDFFVQRIVTGNVGVLFAKGRAVNGFWNDLQDLGYTDSLDDVSWAPTQGWSVAPSGVELILGHTYVVWTWDSHFAKFRVVEIGVDPQTMLPTDVRIDWAYQIAGDNPELAPFWVARAETPSPREES